VNIAEVKAKLKSKGYSVAEEKRLGNDAGTRLKIQSGQIVNVYDNGSVNVQGKNPQEIRALLAEESGSSRSPQAARVPTRVFVVYGHDRTARDQLEAMLRRWGLEPLILDQLPSEGQTVIEKLESLTADASFGVVLATPDDQGHRAGHEDEKTFRARQNVVLELGMLLATLGRNRVAILLKQQENMERPSDIQGLIYIPFKDDLQKDAGPLLAKEMVARGYQIDVSRL